jgi:hypothetical protein
LLEKKNALLPITSGIRDSALPESSGQQVVLSVTKSKPASFQSQAMLLYVCALQLAPVKKDLGQISRCLSKQAVAEIV